MRDTVWPVKLSIVGEVSQMFIRPKSDHCLSKKAADFWILSKFDAPMHDGWSLVEILSSIFVNILKLKFGRDHETEVEFWSTCDMTEHKILGSVVPLCNILLSSSSSSAPIIMNKEEHVGLLCQPGSPQWSRRRAGCWRTHLRVTLGHALHQIISVWIFEIDLKVL